MGPRLSGSEGDAAAVRWAVEKMKQLGLANVHTEPVTVPHWVRGEERAELTAPISRQLAVTALGGSVATPDGGVEAEVLRVTTLEQLKALPVDQVKGRIVFYDKVMERLPSGKGYGDTVDVRRSGAAEAARKGAVASLIRTVGTGDARLPHTGGMRYEPDVPRIPGGALSIPDAELLRRTLERGPARLKLVLSPRALPDAESANVIGEVTGTAKPDEVVLLGAHLDAWDLGDGALDDAAGVAICLDVAQKLVGAPPKRTVRVVLFANEENGLRGARTYAQAHAGELQKHVAAIESDSGAGLASGVLYAVGPGAEKQLAPLRAPLAKLKVTAPKAGDAGGADTTQLPGVPQLELVQDRSRYFDIHHSADDTCDKIRADELEQASAVTLLVARHVANLEGDLGRLPQKSAPGK
ncbi:MAG: M28 family peptidase [Myxococcaceae bacterium]|nr:M28 family peptidase [Myxococcaceae bacterium]